MLYIEQDLDDIERIDIMLLELDLQNNTQPLNMFHSLYT